MKKTHPLLRVYEDVACALSGKGDYSETTIRCTINDYLDALDKEGFKVQFDYNQQFGVDMVRRLLGLI